MLDEDGNVLGTQAFQQGTGADVISLASGQTVARIAAGASFTSSWVDLPIPAGAPDDVRIEFVIDALHYKLGTDEQAAIDGRRGVLNATLVDPPYRGELVDIAPPSSFGGRRHRHHRPGRRARR